MTKDSLTTLEDTVFIPIPDSLELDQAGRVELEKEVRGGLQVFLTENLREEEVAALRFKRLTISTKISERDFEYTASLDYTEGHSVYNSLKQHNSDFQHCADSTLLASRNTKPGRPGGVDYLFKMERTPDGEIMKQLIITRCPSNSETPKMILSLTNFDECVLLGLDGQAKAYLQKKVPWIDVDRLLLSQEYRNELANTLRRIIFLNKWPECADAK